MYTHHASLYLLLTINEFSVWLIHCDFVSPNLTSNSITKRNSKIRELMRYPVWIPLLKGLLTMAVTTYPSFFSKKPTLISTSTDLQVASTSSISNTMILMNFMGLWTNARRFLKSLRQQELIKCSRHNSTILFAPEYAGNLTKVVVSGVRNTWQWNFCTHGRQGNTNCCDKHHDGSHDINQAVIPVELTSRR